MPDREGVCRPWWPQCIQSSRGRGILRKGRCRSGEPGSMPGKDAPVREKLVALMDRVTLGLWRIGCRAWELSRESDLWSLGKKQGRRWWLWWLAGLTAGLVAGGGVGDGFGGARMMWVVVTADLTEGFTGGRRLGGGVPWKRIWEVMLGDSQGRWVAGRISLIGRGESKKERREEEDWKKKEPGEEKITQKEGEARRRRNQREEDTGIFIQINNLLSSDYKPT